MEVLIGLVLAVLLFVGVSYLLPGEVSVARSITINAPADKIFPLVNDLEAAQKWSPWARRDPDSRAVIFSRSGKEAFATAFPI